MAAVEDEKPSTSSSSFSKEEANKLMSQGKRHFVCEEIVEAVKCFEAACLMLNKQYGALSNECGDAHFHYGKSLFELARLENGVLGSALDEAVQDELADSDDDDGSMDADVQGSAPAGADSKSITTANKLIENEEMSAERSAENKMEEEETESKIDDATTEDNKEAEEKATETSEEKPAKEENTEEKMVEDTPAGKCKTEAKCSDVAEKNDIPEDKNKNNKESASQEQKEKDEAISENQDQSEKPEGLKDDKKIEDDKKNGTAEQNDEKDDEMLDDGPVSTIRLAWETLELARIVFKRHNSTEMQLKLAQTHLLLGEIHMEQEQFQDAVSELSKCLNIQKNLLKPDDRLLAETYYNLGLAYTLSMLYEESANHYDNAAEVLELRVKNIKTRIEEAEEQDKGKGKAEDEDPVVKDRKELAELEELLPEIKAKSSDAKNENERLKSNIKMGLESMGVLGSSSSTCSTSCSDKPADDITHLVRKRRKSKNEEESTENVEGPAKKLRQEGESSTTQLENGDSKMEEVADTEAQS